MRALRSAVYNRMVEGGVRSRLAGRMYGAGSRNGDADACVARVVVLVCVVVGGVLLGGGRDVHSDKSLGQGPNLSGS